MVPRGVQESFWVFWILMMTLARSGEGRVWGNAALVIWSSGV